MDRPERETLELADLEAALRRPSRATWRSLCERLERAQALTPHALEALERQLAPWPDRLRTLPGRWLRELAGGFSHPALGLVRSVEVVVFARNPEDPFTAGSPWGERPWAGHPWAECAGLSAVSELRVYDEGMGDEGARAVASSAYLRRLRRLSLASGITAEGAAALARAPSLAGLEALDLGRNRVGEAGVRALVGSPHLAALRSLHLGRNALDRGAVEALNLGLRALEKLDLDFAGLGGDEVEALCASGRLAGLRELNVSNNRVGRAGCEALARCADLRSLEVLFLHDCGLDDAAALTLLASPHLGSLRNLAMSANALTLRSVDALAACAPLASLGELDVCHNDFDAAEAEARLRASPAIGGVGRLCV